MLQEALPLANKFLDFVNRSKSSWHAVDTVRTILLENGYQCITERENWKIAPQGKYFFTRNHSTIIAFAIGGKYVPGNAFKVIGAHTDSPDLRIKPVSTVSKSGYVQVGVQTYGGGLWNTWFDRDLTVAGRVIVKDGDRFQHKLVDVERPILRIPTLAIHLDRSVNTDGFKFNTETQLVPVIATAVQDQLLTKNDTKRDHHSVLFDVLAEKLQVSADAIVDVELSIVDSQPSRLGGAHNEFIFSPRLDNLLSCFCSLEALMNTSSKLDNEEDVHVVAMFDNEEVGSESAPGAGSSLMNDMIARIISLLSNEKTPGDAINVCKSKSFLISADMAHAVHPNYSDKHQEQHRPEMHKGLVIKVNANQRYATTTPGAFLIKTLAEKHNIPLQKFVVRNDSMCGSTIGPILSSSTGIRTIDVGIPQLSMHSIREMCGVTDVLHATNLFRAFFTEFRDLDNKLYVDE